MCPGPIRFLLPALAALGFAGAGTAQPGAPREQGRTAPAPRLDYAFSARIELAPAVEQGMIDGGRRRFVPITGGQVRGPRFTGVVLPGGGDWQTIYPEGLTRIEARYFLKADDGTVVQIDNLGVRTASADVIDRLSRGEEVDPSLYYFYTTPRFQVPSGPHAWLGRRVFIARGVRRPDHVVVDFYAVE